MSLETEIQGCLFRGWAVSEKTSWDMAKAIASLPEMVEMQEKARKWDRQWDITSLPEWIVTSAKSNGWLHKDDPVEGREVVEKCRCNNGTIWADSFVKCPICQGTGEIVRPLTVVEWCNPANWHNVTKGGMSITYQEFMLPSGGRVRVKKG